MGTPRLRVDVYIVLEQAFEALRYLRAVYSQGTRESLKGHNQQGMESEC